MHWVILLSETDPTESHGVTACATEMSKGPASGWICDSLKIQEIEPELVDHCKILRCVVNCGIAGTLRLKREERRSFLVREVLVKSTGTLEMGTNFKAPTFLSKL